MLHMYVKKLGEYTRKLRGCASSLGESVSELGDWLRYWWREIIHAVAPAVALLMALLLIQHGCSAKALRYQYATDWVPPTPVATENADGTSGTDDADDPSVSDWNVATPVAVATVPEWSEGEASNLMLTRAVMALLTGEIGSWPSEEVSAWIDMAAGEGMGAKLEQAVATVATERSVTAQKAAAKAELEILAAAVAVKATTDAEHAPLVTAMDTLVYDCAVQRLINDNEAKYFVSLYGGSYFPVGRHPRVIS